MLISAVLVTCMFIYGASLGIGITLLLRRTLHLYYFTRQFKPTSLIAGINLVF